MDVHVFQLKSQVNKICGMNKYTLYSRDSLTVEGNMQYAYDLHVIV